MKELFDRFKKEVLAELPSEEAKNAAVEAFIYGFSKI